jgi:hypothetical protein
MIIIYCILIFYLLLYHLQTPLAQVLITVIKIVTFLFTKNEKNNKYKNNFRLFLCLILF